MLFCQLTIVKIINMNAALCGAIGNIYVKVLSGCHKNTLPFLYVFVFRQYSPQAFGLYFFILSHHSSFFNSYFAVF